MPPEDAAALSDVLEVLRVRDGLDLSGYRRATVERRIRNRVISAGAPSLAAYAERLRADAAESARLVERLTIKVSRLFRNAAAFEALSVALAADVDVAPRRLTAWSAGCACGEEVYSLAMVLAELGQPGGGPPAVVGTDVDPGALAAAREAVYAEAALAELPAPVRNRWLERAPPAAWRPVPAVRARAAFERHDLARAARPPGSGRFDVVACRNTLIYFDPPLQRRAFALLCEGLAPGGLLFLGEAEWPPPELAPRLRPLDRRHRLFRLEARPHA